MWGFEHGGRLPWRSDRWYEGRASGSALIDERERRRSRCQENCELRQQETSQDDSTGNATARAVMRRRIGDGMSDALPVTYLARHGETAWSLSGQHTGVTDLPLTERGEANARRLAAPLQGVTFAKVLTSPLQRAARTCELAGFGTNADRDPDLVEWNYGAYEGRTSADIHREQPGWDLFRDGCPEGESPGEIASRADRVVDKVRAVAGNVLLFSSGHFLRVLAARWLGLPAGAGRCFLLGTASVSALGYEHTRSQPVIRLWNDTRHVG